VYMLRGGEIDRVALNELIADFKKQLEPYKLTGSEQ
jgi:hypothetical protein